MEKFIGNQKLKKTVSDFLENDRLPQAIIIEGEAGLGKKTAAAYIAAAVLCKGDKKPCLNCDSCRTVFEKTHAEVKYYIPEKSTFTVDMARAIRSNAYLKPLTADYGISVLEHCELMNAEAQNALLKILEEPPASAIFILLTENAGSFLTTVLSRCVLLRVNPLSNDEVMEYLENSTDKSSEEILSAVMLSDGNIGKALGFLGEGDSNEIRDFSKQLFSAFRDRNRIELLKCAAELEKFGSREQVLKLFYEKLLSELKISSGDEKLSLLKSSEATALALERLAANGNKAIVLNNMCCEIIKATKI